MAGLLMDPVATELRRWAREPFDRRSANCALSVLAYVERITGRALLWPRLVGRFAAGQVWGRPARLEAVARQAMAELGCRPTPVPARGDVGLVELPGTGLTACICTGPGKGASQALWAARMASGVAIQPAAATLAWRLPCPRR